MPRKKLTAAEKTNMKQARAAARKAKADATKALTDCGSAFTNEKFWKTVDVETVEAIQKAMDKGLAIQKKAQISALEKQLAALKGEDASNQSND